ncbi:MAG: low-specificity L-threonine aldolase [Burkholderiaceae bacterium]
MIDLRSDTVTRPSRGMLDAMGAASLGDDVWGDDPTVQRLQNEIAARCGKQAGLFFPTGTQSNLAGIMAHCERGDEYIVGQQAHTYKFEGGGAAVLGSVQPQPIDHDIDGTLPLARIQEAIKPIDPHFARTRLLALENTIGGKVLPQAYVQQATELAARHGLARHLDGARAFNAAIHMNVAIEAVCAPFDSASICFSKGLGAPVGSALVGERSFIERAKRWRKVLGGGMRQSGVLAAACLYALDHHVQTLADDHENAAWLARSLASIDEVRVLSHATNMVFVEFSDRAGSALGPALASQGMLVQAVYGGPSRLVLHRDVSREDLKAFVAAVQGLYASGRDRCAAH